MLKCWRRLNAIGTRETLHKFHLKLSLREREGLTEAKIGMGAACLAFLLPALSLWTFLFDIRQFVGSLATPPLAQKPGLGQRELFVPRDLGLGVAYWAVWLSPFSNSLDTEAQSPG